MVIKALSNDFSTELTYNSKILVTYSSSFEVILPYTDLLELISRCFHI